MSRPVGSKSKNVHIWSEEEKEYLKQITPGHHHKEIQELMNKRFGLKLTPNQIKGAISRYKLSTGFTGQFKKGHVPANKGMKGVCPEGSKKTWFKKGNIPANHKPVGSERVNVDGYTEVKVKEPNNWHLKQRVVWEKANGPIPKGCAIVFGDSDKRNFDINNLLLVSRKQLLFLNNNKLIKDDVELTKTGIIIADIHSKISERKQKEK